MRSSEINLDEYIRPIGILDGDRIVKFSGTGFGYLNPKIMLTAQHVIKNSVPSEICIRLPNGKFIQPESVVTHPKADIAVLVFSDDRFKYFAPEIETNVGPRLVLGTELLSFGYPYVNSAPECISLEPRLLTGHLQRKFNYLQYPALELSFPITKGQSGSPVILADSIDHVVGVVTANFESETIVDYHEEHQEGGGKEIHKVTKIQCYGIALSLSCYQEWIKSMIS